MPFVVDPSVPFSRELPIVVRKRLRRAITTLDETDHHDAVQLDRMAHSVRKRCKEVRAAARLVRPSLGEEFEPFNAAVREAASLLAPIRDAYVMSDTFARLTDLPAPARDADDHPVHTLDLDAVDQRIAAAGELLVAARKQVKHWDLPHDDTAFAAGLHATYRRGQKALRRLQKAPDDERAHEWRKPVKQLWYQLRLLERASPRVLAPLCRQLDELAELLGDDHDLAMLIDQLRETPERYGGAAHTDDIIRVASIEQQRLRAAARRVGETLYAEQPDAFVDRTVRYWHTTRERGPEPTPATTVADREAPLFVERERKWLVSELPTLDAPGQELRQGYLAIDGTTSVRVRKGRGATLTIKAGEGAVRTELEWPITDDEFAAAWEQTEHRRIRKTRYRLPLGAHIAELDVFHDELEGLAMVEVEFDSDQAMTSFTPPAWFGSDVTDDEAMTNTALAVFGLRGSRR